jgi:hypothetical protein
MVRLILECLLDYTDQIPDGGTDITMKLNGKAACTSVAKYGGEGHTTNIDGKNWETLAGMSPCTEAIAVKKGDVMTFEARYDLDVHPQ